MPILSMPILSIPKIPCFRHEDARPGFQVSAAGAERVGGLAQDESEQLAKVKFVVGQMGASSEQGGDHDHNHLGLAGADSP